MTAAVRAYRRAARRDSLSRVPFLWSIASISGEVCRYLYVILGHCGLVVTMRTHVGVQACVAPPSFPLAAPHTLSHAPGIKDKGCGCIPVLSLHRRTRVAWLVCPVGRREWPVDGKRLLIRKSAPPSDRGPRHKWHLEIRKERRYCSLSTITGLHSLLKCRVSMRLLHTSCLRQHPKREDRMRSAHTRHHQSKIWPHGGGDHAMHQIIE